MIQPQPLIERRKMLARLTSTLATKPGALSPSERQSLRALTRELDLVEDDILDESEKTYSIAFRRYLVGGRQGLTVAERSLIETRELRDMQSGQGAYPGSGNGPFAPVTFVDQLFTMLKATDELFDENVVTRIETTRGGPAS